VQCLLPLANTPLIEYTLQFLAMSGVQEVYIYCGAFALEVTRHVQQSKWASRSSSPFAKLEILRSKARSVGEALRDVDNRGIITGDFLLVYGDLVANVPIDAPLQAHRARRAANKNAIMTMLLREGGEAEHRTKAHGITPVFVLDPGQRRCVHYEEMSPLQADRHVKLERDLVAEHDELEIRTDLIDCGIDICTPDVLALWTESFDYDLPRRHFLHGVLKDYELNGKTLHVDLLERGYAARASSLQAYDAVTRDVLARYTFPTVPDSNLLDGQRYAYSRGSRYKEDGVILARSCTLGLRTVLGHGTSVGEGSRIANSVIGRRCRIGNDVTITNAHVWDDVEVGDGAVIDHAVIADATRIGRDCLVSPGALISFGVRLAAQVSVAEGARITRAPRDGQPVPDEHDLVGDAGTGYAFDPTALDDGDDAETDDARLHGSLLYSLAGLALSTSSLSSVSSSVASDASDALSASGHDSYPVSGQGRAPGVAEDSLDAAPAAAANFHKDAVADVLRTLAQSGDFDNTRVEFTSLRLSNNASDQDVQRAIAAAVARRIGQLMAGDEPGQRLGAAAAVRAVLAVPGATAFVADVAIGRARALADQVDFLYSLQRELAGRAGAETVLFALCAGLYGDGAGVVDEAAFEAWWQDASGRGREGEAMRAVRRRAGDFVDWLRNAEEESSESASE
jgi:translation initiation factor eIF-2B subunit epsilon